ncbi:MAG: PEP-CTERM sorting domain-containing protein [bacterium]|nr:PEP-CTERM sorting domain-containing protein [bacterium]
MKGQNVAPKYVSVAMVTVAMLHWCGTADAQPTQWTIASGGNGHWYEFVLFTGGESELNWDQTVTVAENGASWAGHRPYLATFTSAAEMQWVGTNIIDPLGYQLPDDKTGWFGAFQDRNDPAYSEPAGGWKWKRPWHDDWDWAAWGYTNWNPGEPNNNVNEHHAIMRLWNGSGNMWNDVQLSGYNHNVGYLVEYLPEPATLSLLTLGGLIATRRRR